LRQKLDGTKPRVVEKEQVEFRGVSMIYEVSMKDANPR